MPNIQYELDDLLQMSDSETQSIYDAVYLKVVEYCEEHNLDTEDIDFSYSVLVDIIIN